MRTLTAEMARELFEVRDGLLINRVQRGTRAAPGTPAGTISDIGYLRTRIDGVRYLVHRVIWLIHYGSWPKNQIDHINGVRHDNRIENLRDVSCQDNQRNQRVRCDSATGIPGVSRTAHGWRARIKVGGHYRHLGFFKDKEEALSARKAAEKLYGFHENHGLRTA